MKVGIISDTHDHLPNIGKAIKIFQAEKIDALIHAGDFIAPFALAPFKALDVPKYFVFGNNDGERAGLQARAAEQGFEIQNRHYQFELGGAKFMIDHYPIELAELAAKFPDRRFVITGHTHRFKIETIAATGGLSINPGEACGYVERQNLLGLLELPAGEYRSVEIPQ